MSEQLWLFGCGKMGGAMLARWIAAGTDPDAITVIDRNLPAAPAGVRVVATPPPDSAPDIVVLAVKPQQLSDATAALAGRGAPLAISILAGVEEDVLADRLATTRIVRMMPNLAVAIGKGVVLLHSRGATREDRAMAEELATALGLAEWIETEPLFDRATALSGSGPAFVYRFTDALAAAGVALGLADEQALRLAVMTVEGAGALAAGADAPPAVLADRVASKGGSTREGLDVLDRDAALQSLLDETLAAAARRNAALAVEVR